MSIAKTPEPPYYAVIFTSLHTNREIPAYDQMAEEMFRLAAEQPGYLGVETARGSEGPGITVSYWENLDAIAAWREQADHKLAQKLGRERWYEDYSLRIAKVERAYKR